jgi:hypothetical protein
MKIIGGDEVRDKRGAGVLDAKGGKLSAARMPIAMSAAGLNALEGRDAGHGIARLMLLLRALMMPAHAEADARCCGFAFWRGR